MYAVNSESGGITEFMGYAMASNTNSGGPGEPGEPGEPDDMLGTVPDGYDGPDLITCEQASTLFRVRLNTVRGWYKRGKIPYFPRAMDGRIFLSFASIAEALRPGAAVWRQPGGGAGSAGGATHDE